MMKRVLVAALAALLSAGIAHAQTISNLPAASSGASTDLFPATQGSTGAGTGTTRKITLSQMQSALIANGMLSTSGGTMIGPLAMGSNLLSGSSVAFTGGSIDGTAIGGTTPAAGSFTTLAANSSATLTNTTALSGSSSFQQLLANLTLTGTTSAPSYYGHQLQTQSSLVPTGANGYFNFTSGLVMGNNSGGTNTASMSKVTVNGTGIGSAYVIAQDAFSDATVNVGGTTTTGVTAIGNMFAFNPKTTIRAGATNWQESSVEEANLAVEASTETATISGTATAGDTVNLIFTSASITGSPLTISATVGTSNTVNNIANQLQAAIQNNANLYAAQVSASTVVGTGVLNLYWPTWITVTVSSSVTGSATESVALSSVTTGGSVASKHGIKIIRLASDSEQAALGNQYEQALLISAQQAPSSGAWRRGIQVGADAGMWPMDVNGTFLFLGTQLGLGGTNLSGDLLPTRLKYLIDTSQVNFTQSGGGILHGPAIDIDGAGTVRLGPGSVAAASTGLTIAATGQTATLSSISNSGGGGAGSNSNNYFVGDTLYDDYQGQWHVTAVNNSTGAVTALNMDVAPSIQTGSPPSNPIPLRGGSGASLTVNLTWTAASTVAIGGSGQTTSVTGTLKGGTGLWTANGSVATTMTSLGPTGSHATVQEWFTVTDSGGTVRYIPAY